jgi:hypothetical protein
MSFQDRRGWQCQFLEADLKTSLPLKLHFKSADKVIELIERGSGITDQESRLMLDQAIMKGRRGVFMSLTAKQYAKLKHMSAVAEMSSRCNARWVTRTWKPRSGMRNMTTEDLQAVHQRLSLLSR